MNAFLDSLESGLQSCGLTGRRPSLGLRRSSGRSPTDLLGVRHNKQAPIHVDRAVGTKRLTNRTHVRSEPGGRHVLLALSGGADSVALARGLLSLRDRPGLPAECQPGLPAECGFDLRLAAAHLNHLLRGEESRHDVEWLTAFARQFDLPLTVETRDVAAVARTTGRGIEETARRLRYEFLRETATRLGCSHVAVAHTADDQAETILHHVIRGTGIAGLCGMRRTRPLGEGIDLVRPLLDVKRTEIERYLSGLGQDFLRDATNTDLAFTRNRLRRSLLPLLEREYNPQIRDALLRLARQAGEVQQALEQLAAELLARAVMESGEAICRVKCDALADQPRHLIRECFSVLWRRLNWPRQRMGFAEWEQLADLVETDGTLMFPGKIEAQRRGKLVVLRRR